MSDNKKKTQKKHHTVREYVLTPIVFVLISLIVVLPLSFALLKFSISTAHKVYSSFSMTSYDFRLDDSTYTKSGVKNGTVTIPSIKYGDKIGELKIRKAGIETSVYYGRNIVSAKYGAGLKTSEKLPGQNGTVEIYANVSGAFSSLNKLEVGDEIKLSTSWGEYVYTVSDVTVDIDMPEAIFPQTLLLYTANDSKVFSTLNEEKLFVLSECKSGPQAEFEEVQE